MTVQHIARGIVRAITNLCDVTQVDRPSAEGTEDDLARLLGRMEESAALDEDTRIARSHLAGTVLAVCLLQHRDDATEAEIPRRKPGRIDFREDDASLSADQGRLSDLGDLLHRVLKLSGKASQRDEIVMITVQGQREDGHVVDRLRLDQRSSDARGDTVEIRLELVIEPHERFLHIRADIETNDDEALARPRNRVDVFHARDFPEQLLHRGSDAFLDLLGRGTGHRDHHIDHRHLNLRLLLAREKEQGEETEQDRGDDDQRRQFRIDESRGQTPGDAVGARVNVVGFLAHVRITGAKRVSSGTGPCSITERSMAARHAGSRAGKGRWSLRRRVRRGFRWNPHASRQC